MAQGQNSRRLCAMLAMMCCMLPLVAQAGAVRIAATVNDAAITSNDVAARRALVMLAANIPATAENEARITAQIVNALVDEQVQLQEAKRQSITVSDAELAKAIDAIGERQGLPSGGIQKLLASKSIPVSTLEDQVRAQLAWTKVVQRKLRRNVTVTQDELRRAAAAEAAAPGPAELQIAALVVPITPKSKEKETKARVTEIAKALEAGKDFSDIAAHYAAAKTVLLSPPAWVAATRLPPELLREIAARKKGEVIGPVRLGNSAQFLRVLAERSRKKMNPATEVTVKQMEMTLPAKKNAAAQQQVQSTLATLRADAGSCESADVPTAALPVKVSFTRSTLAKLPDAVADALAQMEVASVSEPMVEASTLRLMLLCERREPVAGAAPAANPELEQQLMGEKLELEAEKHLRNLKREATIDIREAP